MPDMPGMPALEQCHPVTELVLLEAHNSPIHICVKLHRVANVAALGSPRL